MIGSAVPQGNTRKGISSGPPNRRPIASFNFSPTSGITTTTNVIFNAGASYAVTGTSISNYAWDWGDGTVDNVNSASSEEHDWAAKGTYSVTLTVTDNLGMKASTTQFITVG